MPIKDLTSQTGRKGIQKTFKFGGGKNEITAEDDGGAVSGYGYIIKSGGGDDMIFGSDFTTRAGTGTIVDDRTINGDLLIGGNGSDIVVGGLGNDTIFGGNEDGSDKGKGKSGPPTNTLIGDGGFDASDPANIMLVDSLTVSGAPDVGTGVSAPSFGDTITGGNGSTNYIYGDYVEVTLMGVAVAANAPVYVGGSDTLDGGDNDDGLLIGGFNLPQNNIYGDAEYLTLGQNTEYTGGVDIISGGTNADNSLYGDVSEINFVEVATFKGGDDVITGGDGSLAVNDLYGDAQRVFFNSNASIAEGGDDRLISGTNANDVMHGDFVQIIGNDAGGTVIGGDDRFVFGSNNGMDTIWDFELAEFDGITGDLIDANDIVELIGISGVTSFADIELSFSDAFGDTVLVLGGGNQITFKGLSGADFSADDFVFVA